MKYKRSNVELNEKLKSQLKFIKSSSESYDNGFEDEAQRITTSLRVLFHDTRNSTSLLNSLDIKNSTFIVSSADQYFPANLMPYNGLITMKMTTGIGGEYEPHCYSHQNLPNKWLRIVDWWNEIVIDDKSNVFSRKDIVLTIADQDGGAHVDIELNDAFANLTVNNSLGWMYEDSKMPSRPFEKNPAYACIRQIAHEVIFSFQIRDQIKSYTRYKTNNVATVAFIDDRNYIYYISPDQSHLSLPLFKDSRVQRTELRQIYDDKLILHNGVNQIMRILID